MLCKTFANQRGTGDITQLEEMSIFSFGDLYNNQRGTGDITQLEEMSIFSFGDL